MTYFKRDGRVYELVAEDIRRNYGLGAALIREAAVRDIVTDDVRFTWGDLLAAYEPIGGLT